MSDAKLVNIARLMTTYNFEIEQLPDKLKCAQCKLVLNDACQLPCCCRFCRVCIDDMMTSGSEFCPGDSEDCGQSRLSLFSTDHFANKGVSRLAVKCPHDGCVHKCQLANIEEHLRECPRKGEECPFRELGCTQDKLAADEMGGHLQHANRRHSEILIRMMAKINREIESLKHELMLKDEKIRSIMDQMIHVQNEYKLIKEEKEGLVGRVTILTDKIEREIAERRENDELDSTRVIEHVDREIAAVMQLIGSNKTELANVIQSMRDDIRSINQVTKLVNENISGKLEIQSTKSPYGQVGEVFEWMFVDDIRKTGLVLRQSKYITGQVPQYQCQLESMNLDVGTPHAVLCFQLRTNASPYDHQYQWPFSGRVAVTVTDMDKLEICASISQQYRIERIGNPLGMSVDYTIQYRDGDTIRFFHSELIKSGLNLSRGVRVSYFIVPGAD